MKKNLIRQKIVALYKRWKSGTEFRIPKFATVGRKYGKTREWVRTVLRANGIDPVSLVKLSKERRRSTLTSLVQRGLTVNQIAKRLHVSYAYARAMLDKQNLKATRQKIAFRALGFTSVEKLRSTIGTLLSQRMLQTEIAKRYKVTPACICNTIRKFNVPRATTKRVLRPKSSSPTA